MTIVERVIVLQQVRLFADVPGRVLAAVARRATEQQVDAGAPIPEVTRALGISEATYYVWRKKYGQMAIAEIRRLSDSLVKAVAPTGAAAVREGEQIHQRALQTCGEEPAEPASPEMESELDYSSVRAAGVRASGMNSDAYAIMRERVVAFVASNGKSSGGMILTEDEVAVLKASLEQLKPFKELLQSA